MGTIESVWSPGSDRIADPSKVAVARPVDHTGAVKVADPLCQLNDAMEEVSMMFESKEMKNIAERKLGATRVSESARPIRVIGVAGAVARWSRILPDMPSVSQVTELLSSVRQNAGRADVSALLARLSALSRDPTVAFAVLDCLKSGLSAEETAARALVDEAVNRLGHDQGRELRAGLNIADEVNRRAGNPADAFGLREMYRGEVLGYTTPQQCFRSLLASVGSGRLTDSVRFLVASLGADIRATTPSTERAELRRITLDLQCVAVLAAVFGQAENLVERMRVRFGESPLLSGDQMTERIVDMTERPFPNPALVSGFIEACGIQGLLSRLDFMTRFIRILRTLSPRLFKDEKDRIDLVGAAQDVLDEIIEKAEDEEEKEESGK